MSWAARRHSSSRPIVLGLSSTRAGASCTNFNIGVLLPAGLTRQARWWFNLEGTSRASSDPGSTTLGYNSGGVDSSLERYGPALGACSSTSRALPDELAVI